MHCTRLTSHETSRAHLRHPRHDGRRATLIRVGRVQIICFYHKEAEAYLDFHTSLGDEPVFRESTRVAVKSRKKASWMWKIESLTVNAAASPVVCGESMQYRIKHIVTNRYLAEHPDGTRLIMTNDYLTPGASFSFKSFTKEKGADLTDASIHKLGLVYIRTNTGALLHQEVPHPFIDQDAAHLKIDTLKKVGLRNSEAAASEADAVLVMNVLPSSFKSVVTVRRALHTFAGFADLLESIPIPPPSSSADSGPSRGPSSSDHRSPHVSAAASVTRVSADLVLIGDVPTRALPPRPPSHNQACSPPVAVLQGETMQGDATPPARLSDEADMVLKHTDTCYQALMETLKTLVLNSTFDDDTNPMSRDGPPNRLMQKLLRELQAISTLMRMVQLPFQRGLTSAWMGSGERRFQQLVDVISLAYRLLKQICKENERNALELHQYTPTIRDHLGKGMSCTITLKEIYVGKRKLLAMVRPDLVNQFMDLLHSIKDPRYVDFLCAVCTTDGAPVVALQQMIIDGLVHNAELLPVCRVTNFKQGVRLGIHVPGTKDESGRDLYLDVADFGDHRKVKSRDMASHILTAPFGELTQTESTLRYFVRCINLYANVCLGRNQKALSFLLKNSSMPFQYDTILSLLREQTLPALIRARLTSLMIRLYVDRSPQSSAPQILYTRIWSKVKPAGGEHWGALRRNIGHPSSSSATYDTPVCITGFTDLCEFVLSALPLLGGAKGKDGEKSLNFSPTYGQIELVSAQVELCDLMLDFGFFTKNRDSVDCDFSDIQHLFEAVFAMLLLRLLNLRANYRVSVCLDTWEQIFEQKQGKEGGTHFLQMGSFPSTMANLSRTESKREDESSALNTIFAPNKAFFESCIARCFKQDIISSGVIKSDTYAAGNFTGDPLACALMLRHMSQRSRVMNDLQMVQVLVFPAAVKVYDETEFAIKRLISLRKHISRDEPAAYEEATSLLKRLTGYVTVSPQFTAEFVEKHQRIMLNRELDEPVVDMLQLNLERDTSRRDALTDQGERDADPPVIPARRDLFQVCYDFLKMLCKGNPQAQKRLFPLIEIFSEHVGIEKLNVADTICEIVRDNARLISQVPEALMRHFMTAIHTWGRKARWLRFFEVFLEIGGIPFRRNQDLILRLVMEDWDALLDLSCDYSQPNQDLPQSDPRQATLGGVCMMILLLSRAQGATLLQLIQNGEHRMEVRSLVKYHFSSINLLALCAAGKNAMNKARILQHVKFDQVRLAWTKMMHHVFLASLDTQSVVQVQEGMRVWVDDSPAIDSERYPGMEGVCLMQEFLRDLASLTFRLKALTKPPPGGIFTGVKDAWGHDVGCHIQYALLVVQGELARA
ncbi:hypothetical protein T484DRAFT_1784348 [Baffinella frigidus]|nr:hypothetical protein T484DRAFT_1784348 [Cryptophyta sp. CCMP2293]